MSVVAVSNCGETTCVVVVNIEPMGVSRSFLMKLQAGVGLDVGHGGQNCGLMGGGEIRARYDISQFLVGPMLVLLGHDQLGLGVLDGGLTEGGVIVGEPRMLQGLSLGLLFRCGLA